MLYSFQKRSESGIATPKPDVALIEKRLKALPAQYGHSGGPHHTQKTQAGTGNVLVDLGFDDAEELSTKAALAIKFNELMDEHDLSQMQAAAITGMTQPKVSQIRRYKLQNISLEPLMHALVSFDQGVEIIVQPARRSRVAGITVAA